MRPGPSTFRPYVLADEMAKFMVDHKLESSPITTSDGRLVGLLLQTDVLNGLACRHERMDGDLERYEVWTTDRGMCVL